MKYILGIAGLVVILIVAIVLIASRGPAPTQQGKKAVVLSEYADKDAKVVLTTQGKIVGEEDFRTVRISVTRTERVVEVLDGYEETFEKRNTYQNSEAAYSTFIKALDKAGFSREKKTDIKDETGVCPLGRRYQYDLKEGTEATLHLWSTSCSQSQGSFGGNSSLVRELFESQIPDYDKFIAGVKL
jgi:hypothetical protein